MLLMQTPCQGATGGPDSESRGHWPLLAPPRTAPANASSREKVGNTVDNELNFSMCTPYYWWNIEEEK